MYGQEMDWVMTQDFDARYQFRLPKRLLEAAKAKARQKDVLLSQVLRQALREFVADDPPKKPRGKGTIKE